MKVNCLRCHHIFNTFLSEVKKGKGKYCSMECFHPPLVINCSQCNKEFRISPSRIKVNKKYCSRLCESNSRVGGHGQWLGKKRPDLKETNAAKTMFKKGITPWNKGIEWLEMRGKNNPRWVGNKIKHEDKRLRKNNAYKDWRTAVYERDNYTCQMCGQRGGKLQADHIKPFDIYKELRYEISNGRTLCVDCHKKTDTYGIKTYLLKKNFLFNYE